MQKINFQNLPNTTTPINATNLNAIQSNVENIFNGNDVAGNMVVSGIKTKNMFDKGNFVEGININSSGTYISESASGAGISYVKVEAGKTYTISSNTNRAWYYNFSTSIPALNGTGTARTGESGTARTFTAPSGYNYFCLRSYPSNNEDNINQNIQVEEGTTATNYTLFQNLNPKISDKTTETLNNLLGSFKLVYKSSTGNNLQFSFTNINASKKCYLVLLSKGSTDGTFSGLWFIRAGGTTTAKIFNTGNASTMTTSISGDTITCQFTAMANYCFVNVYEIMVTT